MQSVSTEYDCQNRSDSPPLIKKQDENKFAFEILQKMKELMVQPLIPPTIYDSEPSQIVVLSPKIDKNAEKEKKTTFLEVVGVGSNMRRTIERQSTQFYINDETPNYIEAMNEVLDLV